MFNIPSPKDYQGWCRRRGNHENTLHYYNRGKLLCGRYQEFLTHPRPGRTELRYHLDDSFQRWGFPCQNDLVCRQCQQAVTKLGLPMRLDEGEVRP